MKILTLAFLVLLSVPLHAANIVARLARPASTCLA